MDNYRALAEAIFDAGKDVLATSLRDIQMEDSDGFFIFASYYIDDPDDLFPFDGHAGREGSVTDER